MLNKAQLIGHVGDDPEILSTSTGKKLASFSIATTEKWTKDGVKNERTEWHRITVFNEALVNVVKSFVRKGSKIYLEGTIRTENFEKDGQKHYATKIVLENFGSTLTLLDKKPESAGT